MLEYTLIAVAIALAIPVIVLSISFTIGTVMGAIKSIIGKSLDNNNDLEI